MPSPLASHENYSREVNIRSPRYYIARTVSTCWHCGSPTALVAIAVPPGHETLDVDDDASDEGSDGETQHREHPAAAWSVADHNAFLFYVDSLPAEQIGLGCPSCSAAVATVRGIDERGDHQAVPIRKNFVVEARVNPLFPRVEKALPQRRKPCFRNMTTKAL